MLHRHSPREDLIGVIALIVYVITCGSLSGGRNGSILDSHTIYFLSFGAFNLQESPLRIRGEALRLFSPHPQQRITPAHAGKSTSGFSTSSKVKDHPRACGEKGITGRGHAVAMGSPPRMRGKGIKKAAEDVVPGITPAHAGKRAGARNRFQDFGDHPRACGEKFRLKVSACPCTGSPPRMRGKVS